MIRYFTILTFAVCLFSPQLYAQKNISLKKRFKEAQTAIKKASGQENIEKILLDSMALSTTTDVNKANGFHLCALLEQSINDGMNMKAYLKENIDTVRFFKTIYNIYDYTLKSDSADKALKYDDKNIRLRTMHRKNLLGGGKFLLRKEKWSEAYEFFDMFLKTCTTDADSLVRNVAYWTTVCGMNDNKPHLVLKYVDRAIEGSAIEDAAALSEYKARSYQSLGDSASWLAVLEEGTDKYPGYSYFFLNLMDYYIRHGKTSIGQARTDFLLRADGDRAMYWLAMSMFAIGQGDYEECVKMSEECLKREPDNLDALYNKGISLLNMALEEKNSSKCRSLYYRALEPMERVRELQPNEPDRWCNPLYRIYLNLNMGEKFKEIDTIMEELYSDEEEKSVAGRVKPSRIRSNVSIDNRLGRQ